MLRNLLLDFAEWIWTSLTDETGFYELERETMRLYGENERLEAENEYLKELLNK